jgi:hypothetical protein
MQVQALPLPEQAAVNVVSKEDKKLVIELKGSGKLPAPRSLHVSPFSSLRRQGPTDRKRLT